jgi:hypothetical protein
MFRRPAAVNGGACGWGVGSGCTGGRNKLISTICLHRREFGSPTIATNLPCGCRPILIRAYRMAVEGLAEAWNDFTARHPDPERPERKVLPDFSMEPQHNRFSVIFVLHPQDETPLIQFLATAHMSKLKMARTPGVTAPCYDWIYIRPKSAPRAQPLWQILGQSPPRALPDGRSIFRCFPLFSVIDLGELAGILADCPPVQRM